MANQKKLTRSDLRSVFYRSNLHQGSWNFERMQSLGYAFQMVPAIRRLYPAGSQERKDAIKRHLEFYNTHPYMTAPILGINLAMEEQRANGMPIDDAAINGMKVGLMGPLAGVGDPIFWGTLRPVIGAFCATIAAQGSVLGPILFFVLYNLIRLLVRYVGIVYGYRKGMEFVSDMGGGMLQKLTEASSILGLFIMGALVSRWTHIDIPVVLSRLSDQNGQEHVTTIQSVLDSLMPGLAGLLCTFTAMWLLRRSVGPLWIIFGIFIISIFGYWIGLLA